MNLGPPTIPATPEDRIRRDVEALAATPRHRQQNAEALEAARRHVEAELHDAGWTVTRHRFTRRAVLGVSDVRREPWWRLRLHRDISGTNLVATRAPGPGRPIALGAHLDTVAGSPGADDNASGVAVLLEVARRLPRHDGPGVMLIVFDLEEIGFVGSRALAKALAARPRSDGRPAAMICLETVGCYHGAPGSQTVPPGIDRLAGDGFAELQARGLPGDFLAIIERRSSRPLARRLAAAARAAEVPTVSVHDPRPDGVLGALAGVFIPPFAVLDRSDHVPFWRRRIPAVLLTDTADLRNAHYHRPEDQPATLDYERLARLSAALVDAVGP